MSGFVQLNARLRSLRQSVLCGETECCAERALKGIDLTGASPPCPPYRKLHFATTVQLVDAPGVAAALLGTEDVQCEYYVNFEENALCIVAVSPQHKAVTLTIYEAFV